ncbi:hypothetical protein [Streptomyces sp. KR55]|uniref:hypothetical protein n=1 Tax=Streptomyces sp. KR55 TaxID=3457425 RepID=UPI003FD17189
MSDFIVPVSNADFPPCMDRGGNPRFPCFLSGDHSGDHRDSLGNTWPRTCGDFPDVPADSWQHGACNLPADHSGDHVNDACHTWAEASQTNAPAEPQREEFTALRPLGFDAVTGKRAYVLPEPGGVLDKAADMFALESATVWHSLAAAMVQSPEALPADEANFILARVVESLGEVIPIAAQAIENNPAADLPLWSESGRDIGAVMRDTKL